MERISLVAMSWQLCVVEKILNQKAADTPDTCIRSIKHFVGVLYLDSLIRCGGYHVFWEKDIRLLMFFSQAKRS